MVTDLLGLGHRGKDQAATLDPIGLLDAAQHVIDHSLVEGGLLGCQVAQHVHLQLLGQVGDDRRVRLDPAQDEWRGEPAESFRYLVVPMPLDRFCIPLLERRRRSEHPRIGELQN
jgi:hypothetical protein